MSKSLRNVVEPRRLAEGYGVDAVRYHLMRDVNFGLDGDFSHAALVGRINADLANDLGNLLNRTVALVEKLAGGVVPPPGLPGEREGGLRAAAGKAGTEAATEFEAFRPHRALEAIWALCGEANRFVDASAPWALAKAGKTGELHAALHAALEALRWIGRMSFPVMPAKARTLLDRIGDAGPLEWPRTWGGLPAGAKVARGEPLFPRIDKDREAAIAAALGVPATPAEAVGAASPTTTTTTTTPTTAPTPTPTPAPAPSGVEGPAPTPAPSGVEGRTPAVPATIAYEDFAKLDLRIARVLAAERVPKADKLVRLSIDAGEGEPRTIVAGIATRYAPGDLVGRRIVLLANLEARKLRGIESRGMLLAATHEGRPCVLTVDDDVPPGTRVS
jgi:methionyl-tRNA synthetase